MRAVPETAWCVIQFGTGRGGHDSFPDHGDDTLQHEWVEQPRLQVTASREPNVSCRALLMTLVFGVKFLTLQFTRDGFRQSGDDFFCAGTKDLVLPTCLQNPQHARRSYGSLTWGGATPPPLPLWPPADCIRIHVHSHLGCKGRFFCPTRTNRILHRDKNTSPPSPSPQVDFLTIIVRLSR